MTREAGAEEQIDWSPKVTQPDIDLMMAAANAGNATVGYLVDDMTGRQLRESRARLAAEKVRLEGMAMVVKATLSQMTDALRARE